MSDWLHRKSAWLAEEGITVEPGVITVGGKRFFVDRHVQVDAVVEPPRLVPWVSALACASMFGVPLAFVIDAHTRQDLSWLVVIPVLVAAAAIRQLMSTNERYHVVLTSDTGEQRVLTTSELQHSLYVVAMLRDAVRGTP